MRYVDVADKVMVHFMLRFPQSPEEDLCQESRFPTRDGNLWSTKQNYCRCTLCTSAVSINLSGNAL